MQHVSPRREAGLGPALTDLYGRAVELQGGRTVTADEAYLRESIVNPQAKIVAGFQPTMPTFQGLVTEEQLLQLVAYVRSLHQSGVASGRRPPRHAGSQLLSSP